MLLDSRVLLQLLSMTSPLMTRSRCSTVSISGLGASHASFPSVYTPIAYRARGCRCQQSSSSDASDSGQLSGMVSCSPQTATRSSSCP